MKKTFLFLPVLLSIFTICAAAQQRSIGMQATGFVARADDSDITNRPRIAAMAKKLDTESLERRVLDLINAKRAAMQLEPLRWSGDAAKIARLHSSNMAELKFFDHVGRDGLSVDGRADALGVSKWRAIGENIAYNRGYENPLEFACESWMKSPGHRDNLLNGRWKETGIGIAVTADGTYYFTQVFLQK